MTEAGNIVFGAIFCVCAEEKERVDEVVASALAGAKRLGSFNANGGKAFSKVLIVVPQAKDCGLTGNAILSVISFEEIRDVLVLHAPGDSDAEILNEAMMYFVGQGITNPVIISDRIIGSIDTGVMKRVHTAFKRGAKMVSVDFGELSNLGYSLDHKFCAYEASSLKSIGGFPLRTDSGEVVVGTRLAFKYGSNCLDLLHFLEVFPMESLLLNRLIC